VNYREVTRKLLALGCTELPRKSGGSHRKWFNPALQKITSLPDWGSRDLKLGTVRAAVKQSCRADSPIETVKESKKQSTKKAPLFLCNIPMSIFAKSLA
jgi:predicted RNA binding protein YcfA (HicA-like mRNA interferase family)